MPSPVIVRVCLYVGWAIVLAALVLRISKIPSRLRRLLGGLVAVWTLLPGSLSPAYWLGLAFQAPSLTLIALAAISFLAELGSPAMPEAASESMPGSRIDDGYIASAAPQRAIDAASIAGIALGWLLLLDTFALLPFSLYAIGFSTATLAAVTVLVLLQWIVVGAREGSAPVALVGILVLTLFVAVRLPTGNVWDALLDPLLWLGLQAGWLGRALRRFTWRNAAATRA